VLFSAFTAGLPSPLQLGGFLLALAAIALISRPERAHGPPKGIGMAVLAGCAFGFFFIILSRVSPGSTFWPLAVARFSSVVCLLIVLLARGQRELGQLLPGRNVALLVVVAGVLDAVGNAFFVLAAHSGRLDVAAILSSFYPAATVLLAAMVLRERVTRVQGVGILLVLLAVPMISA
jgi:drug/metabolite transporter (DMT)-like permease